VEFPQIEPERMPISTVALARKLIGMVVVRTTSDGIVAGRIIETEAYPPNDPASHAYVGRRPRNRSMFLGPLHAYVYLIYGQSWCFNITSERAERGAAVLIRALEPIAGLDLMRRRRGGSGRERDLCRGPGRLAQALAIDCELDGCYLPTGDDLWLSESPGRRGRIGVSPRIGITRAADRPLRFYERGNLLVSGPQRLSP
jgi:DNA-3-methyladenine glycosylase